ncbi:hypothetical protein ACSSVY_001466 [Roseovarius sp. MBR-51]
MTHSHDKQMMVPLGVVMRRTPGVTRWAAWAWRAVAVLPGASPADWRELRRDGDMVEYHAGTVMLDLHHTQTEAYLNALAAQVPSVFVMLRNRAGADPASAPFDVVLVTASPFEAQDYADNGEDIVEKVPMPEGLVALVRDFIEAHHEEEVFKKRRRDKLGEGPAQDGIGDARIVQPRDVFATPERMRRGRLN